MIAIFVNVELLYQILYKWHFTADYKAVGE